MTQNVSEYLEKSGIETQLYTTKKPDIVFQIDGKRYAIEIETGSMLSRKKALKERVVYLKKNYDKWCFVVIDRNKVKKYKEIGNTIDMRYVKTTLNRFIKLEKKTRN